LYSGLAASKQDASAKDASGGFPGLTLFKINFKNAANTFTNFFTNATTAARTYTFPDKDITVAGIVDITDATITATDITTNDVSTSKHGFFPKLPAATGKYLKDDMTWAAIAGGGDLVSTNNLSDVANAATARNNILPAKTGNSLKVLRVNSGETDYEVATISAGGGDGGFAFKYAFATATTSTPSTGTIQFDNATPSAVTLLYIHDTDASSVVIDAYTDLTEVNDRIIISNADRSKYHVFTIKSDMVSGASVDTYSVTYNFGVGSFSAAEVVYLAMESGGIKAKLGIPYLTSQAIYFI
jgi:hypothetical protein